MGALLARLQAVCGSTFKTYTRRFTMWEQLVQLLNAGSPFLQPALMLMDSVGLGGGVDTWSQRGRGSPKVVTLSRTICIYATLPGGDTTSGQDGVTPGGSVFHPLIEAVESAFDPDDQSQNALTLGGLVSHCWLEGDGYMMTGEIDVERGQGMQTMPVKIMLYPTSR